MSSQIPNNKTVVIVLLSPKTLHQDHLIHIRFKHFNVQRIAWILRPFVNPTCNNKSEDSGCRLCDCCVCDVHFKMWSLRLSKDPSFICKSPHMLAKPLCGVATGLSWRMKFHLNLNNLFSREPCILDCGLEGVCEYVLDESATTNSVSGISTSTSGSSITASATVSANASGNSRMRCQCPFGKAGKGCLEGEWKLYLMRTGIMCHGSRLVLSGESRKLWQ